MNIKNIVQKIIARLGYRLVPLSTVNVNWESFLSLAKAYEYSLNLADHHITESKDRFTLLAHLSGTLPPEAYFIVRALAEVKTIRGDICEFGVAQGETSALIANEIRDDGEKILHLFDSFEGLPAPTEKDQLRNDVLTLGNMNSYAGKMSYPEDMVRARLEAISFPKGRYMLHKGFIDRVITTNKDLPHSVSFAFVDFDFYEPIKLALNFLHGVTPSGAIIIVDDYDYFSTGAKIAVDEFIQENNANKLSYDLFIPNESYGHFAIISKK